MKTKILAMALLLGMGIAQNSYAEGGYDQLAKAIRKSVCYPEFAKSEKIQALVLVKYAVELDGRIAVLEMNASDVQFAMYVKECLEKIAVADTSATGVHYAKFTFRFADN